MAAAANQVEGAIRQRLGLWHPTITPVGRWTIRTTMRDQDDEDPLRPPAW
jgi:hypothetical protein